MLPSRTEGLPAAAIEAALCGLPIVATDVGYVADVVEDQVTGILVPPDDPDALARGLDRGLASDAGLGAAARATCSATLRWTSSPHDGTSCCDPWSRV